MNSIKGFTLIELLITLFLSTILIGGVIKIFSDNKALNLMHSDLNNMQTEALSVNIILTKQLRKAGFFSNTENNYTVQPFNWNKTTSTYNSDSISIIYENLNNEVDCDGNNTPIIENHYYVANNTLYCNNVELLNNVEVLKLLYGVDLNEDNIADRYLSANEAKSLSENDLTKITEVKFSFLVKGNVQFGEPTLKKINLLGVYYKEYEDSYNYRIFSRNILLKNML